MMDILEKTNEQIEKNREEMIASLSQLISIPSVVADGQADMPFGENVHKAYRYMMKLGESEGFSSFDADNYGGHLDFPGKGEGLISLAGHLDVVPEGDNWDFEPYGGEVIDGYICGRGAIDDKGPTIASFYAMKALKQCGYEPKRTIRLILGLDEETNWEGMQYYLNQVDQTADFGFVPDGEFPAIHGEKGILVFDIVKKFVHTGVKGLELTSIKGGNAANSVADYARAVLYDSTGAGYEKIKEHVADFRREKDCKINGKGVGKSFEITVKGVSAHGATPEQGENAITMMLEFLGRLNFANEDTNDFISFYNTHIGYDFHGERIGCAFEDEPSGKLAFNVGMLRLDKKAAQLTINIRYPVTIDGESVYEGIMPILDPYGLGVVKGKHQLPIYVEADAPLIRTLTDVYRKHTGDESSQPLVIGGGTYARSVKNTVAYGAGFPDEPDVVHQKNERISIDSLIKLTKIYAEAMYRLSEME